MGLSSATAAGCANSIRRRADARKRVAGANAPANLSGVAHRDPERFARAIAAFDAANAGDPRSVDAGDGPRPGEVVDAERLSQWVERLDPNASEALRLAARCQHIRRWEIARSSFEPGRVGYLKWRKALSRFHADTAAGILSALGYDAETIERVRRVNLKQDLRSNPDAQTMEDALCLTFLEHELEEFQERHAEDKVVEILRKTWAKMSERGRRAALGVSYGDRVQRLLARALAASDAPEASDVREKAPDGG
jgi:hypothetical protein